jgi:hypothetical protein
MYKKTNKILLEIPKITIVSEKKTEIPLNFPKNDENTPRTRVAHMQPLLEGGIFRRDCRPKGPILVYLGESILIMVVVVVVDVK